VSHFCFHQKSPHSSAWLLELTPLILPIPAISSPSTTLSTQTSGVSTADLFVQRLNSTRTHELQQQLKDAQDDNHRWHVCVCVCEHQSLRVSCVLSACLCTCCHWLAQLAEAALVLLVFTLTPVGEWCIVLSVSVCSCIIDFPNLGITYNGGWCTATIARWNSI